MKCECPHGKPLLEFATAHSIVCPVWREWYRKFIQMFRPHLVERLEK